MKLSTKSRYGLRILVQIAIDSGGSRPVKGNVIAKKQEISEPYLEQIMIPLKTSGMIKTVRGCNGGYSLNREPKKISVLDVIELFEGKLELVRCEECKRQCRKSDKCPTYSVWDRLSDVLRKEAAKITVAQIMKRTMTENRPEYVI